MLILTRRVGEKVILYMDNGLKIEIGITTCRRPGATCLAFTASKDVHIDREEIYQRKLASGLIREKK